MGFFSSADRSFPCLGIYLIVLMAHFSRIYIVKIVLERQKESDPAATAILQSQPKVFRVTLNNAIVLALSRSVMAVSLARLFCSTIVTETWQRQKSNPAQRTDVECCPRGILNFRSLQEGLLHGDPVLLRRRRVIRINKFVSLKNYWR